MEGLISGGATLRPWILHVFPCGYYARLKPIRLQDFFDAVQQVSMFWAVLNASPERP